jgi:hypothetical protein
VVAHSEVINAACAASAACPSLVPDEGEDYFETYRKLGRELKISLYFAPALKGHDNLATLFCYSRAMASLKRCFPKSRKSSGYSVESFAWRGWEPFQTY